MNLRILPPIIFLFLGFSSTSFTQEVDINLEVPELSEEEISEENEKLADNEEKILEEIDETSFKAVDDLIDKNKKVQKMSIRQQYFKKREKPWSPIPFRARLKKGALVEDIKTGKQHLIKRNIFVLAQEEAQGSVVSYILGKDNLFKFKTNTTNLESIEYVLGMYPNIDPEETWFDKDEYHTPDRKLVIENHLTYHAEAIESNYIALIYELEDNSGSSNRAQLKTYYRTVLPVHFGLSIGIRNGVFNSGADPINISTLTFGPTVKWNFAKWGSWDFNTKIGFEKDLYYRITNTNQNVNLSSNLWDFELEGIWNTRIGQILLGYSYRRTRVNVASSDSAFSFPSSPGVTRSSGLFAGYKIDFSF